MKSLEPEASEGEVAFLQATMKSELRRRMRSVRALLPAAVRAERSQRACERVLALPQYASARTLLAYVATAKELDAQSLIAHALGAGKTLVLPRVSEQTLGLHAYRADDALETNELGLQEPLAAAPRVEPAQIDLVLVPALAIDPRGFRIGYGGGFYDRVLPTLARAYKVSLVYDFQLISEAPVAAHDIPVDAIVTDTRCLLAER